MCVYNTFFYGSGFTTLIRFNYWILCETVLPGQGGDFQSNRPQNESQIGPKNKNYVLI